MIKNFAFFCPLNISWPVSPLNSDWHPVFPPKLYIRVYGLGASYEQGRNGSPKWTCLDMTGTWQIIKYSRVNRVCSRGRSINASLASAWNLHWRKSKPTTTDQRNSPCFSSFSLGYKYRLNIKIFFYYFLLQIATVIYLTSLSFFTVLVLFPSLVDLRKVLLGSWNSLKHSNK